MSKENIFEENLETIFKIKTFNLLLYSSIRTQIATGVANTVREGVHNFAEIYYLKEEEINIDSLIVIYQNTKKIFSTKIFKS